MLSTLLGPEGQNGVRYSSRSQGDSSRDVVNSGCDRSTIKGRCGPLHTQRGPDSPRASHTAYVFDSPGELVKVEMVTHRSGVGLPRI